MFGIGKKCLRRLRIFIYTRSTTNLKSIRFLFECSGMLVCVYCIRHIILFIIAIIKKKKTLTIPTPIYPEHHVFSYAHCGPTRTMTLMSIRYIMFFVEPQIQRPRSKTKEELQLYEGHNHPCADSSKFIEHF